MSRELLARGWAAGGGPGDDPLTIDLDSTVCETYGLAKEGAQRHNYAGKRGYHPLLAIAARTGDVLMARLRQGRANTARGAAHFLRETVGRVRYAGATGELTVRADSGFYNRAIVAACRKLSVRFSITVRQHASLRNIIEAIRDQDWKPIPYWMEGAADVAETEYPPFQHEPDATAVRLIVRRVKPTPGSQLALFAHYSYHACITDRAGDTLVQFPHRAHHVGHVEDLESSLQVAGHAVVVHHQTVPLLGGHVVVLVGEGAVDPGHGLQQPMFLQSPIQYSTCSTGASNPVSNMSTTTSTSGSPSGFLKSLVTWSWLSSMASLNSMPSLGVVVMMG